MYCKKCGKNIENDSNYCKNCGHPVEKIKKSYTGLIIVGIIIIVLTFIGAINIGKKIAYYIEETEDTPLNTDEYYNDDSYNEDDYFDDYFDNFPYNDYNKEDTEKENIDNFNNIDIDKFVELKKEATKSIIVLGERKNTSCYQQLLHLYPLTKLYNIKINYLDLTEFDTEDYEKLKNSDEMFSSPWNIPLILIVQNDKIIDKNEGLLAGNKLIEFLMKSEIIN